MEKVEESLLNEVLQQLGARTIEIHEVEDSFSSTVYRCKLRHGERVYVKIPYTKIKFQRELDAYEILRGNVPVPEMLSYWSGNDECSGAFLLSELKGKPLTPEASPKVAFQVGSLHASMHNIKPDAEAAYTGIRNEFPTWTDFVENQFYSFAEEVKEVVEEGLYNKSLEKFLEMKDRLPPSDGPSFVHMDFRPANIIVDGEEVSGTIDFESVRFGSADIDFTKIHRDFLGFDPSLYQAYQDGYRSIRPLIDLDAVLPFYQFTDAFNGIGWCKRRGTEKNAAFLKENIKILKRKLQ